MKYKTKFGQRILSKLEPKMKMESEKIYRFWRFVYSNSHEYPFCSEIHNKNYLNVQEKNREYEARRVFGRFWWVINIYK